MNIYEKMKNDLMLKISNVLPELDRETLGKIAVSLDEVSSSYTICEAEQHIAIIGKEEFQKVIKTYIVAKHMEGLSETTLKNYAMYLNHFMQSVLKPIDQITANDIRLFLYGYQNRRGVSNRSLDSMRSVICTFMKWAASEGYIPSSPVETIKPIKYIAKPRQALEQIDLEIIRRACETSREQAIIEVLYSTGCRVSELINIRLSDINWDARTVLLLGKGKKYRTSYINAKAEVAIHSYLKQRSHVSEYLFCNDRGGGRMSKSNIERMIRQIKVRAGFDSRKITPHTFRHTTATQALRSGMPVNDIQVLLGHANVATTMIYAHTSYEAIQAEHRRCVV